MVRKVEPFLGRSYGYDTGEGGWGDYTSNDIVDDAIITQLSVENDSLTTPPAIVNGERYLVASGATGAWAGKDGQIAAAVEGGWKYIVPSNGWIMLVKGGTNAGKLRKRLSGVWSDVSGGSSIPTISANTTINVPGDYSTVNAALNYVRSAVVLNGADVTIQVANGTTLNEQIVLTNEHLPFLTLSFGTINVNTTGFVTTLLGVYKAFVTLEGSTIRAITGAVSKTSGPSDTIGVMAVEANLMLGTYAGATCSFNNFTKPYNIITSKFTAASMNASGCSDVTDIQNSNGWILNGTLSKGLRWWGGIAQIDTLNVTGVSERALDLKKLSLFLNGTNLTQSGQYTIIDAQDCDIKGTFGSITSPAFTSGLANVFSFTNCDVNVYANQINMASSTSASYLFYVSESSVRFGVATYTAPTAYLLTNIGEGAGSQNSAELHFITSTDITYGLTTKPIIPLNTPTVKGYIGVKDDYGNYVAVNSSTNLNNYHWGRWVNCTGGSLTTLTVNDTLLDKIPNGEEITISRTGAGSVTFAIAGAATITSKSGLVGIASNGVVKLKKISGTNFHLYGDLI